ncbi:MAG TPA: hypothetical protein VMB91_11910 [Solirubrobacteraceae bacterium]|nr:hypothetical protein [Solirubrobacteraceae bacterium]
MGSGRSRPDARDSHGGRAPADPAPRARRLRGRSLLLALLGALALSGLVAQPALATRKVNIVFGCSKIVFEYAGFPEAEKANVVTEKLRADGTNEFTEKFEFSGGEGKSEVPIPAPLAAGLHKLTAEAHWNTNGVIGESGKHREHVKCGAEAKPEFTVGKTQQIAGSSGPFTAEKLNAKLGQTVDYQITISNSGNVSLTLGTFMDPGCDPGTIAGPPAGTPVAPGAKVLYTCNHLLSGGGLYTNVASAEATYEGGKTEVHESNKVLTSVVLEARLSLSKTQEVKGSGAGFTASTLTASVGQTVLYQIAAKNTGNVSLDVTEFTDIYCEGISPGIGETLAPGQTVVFTCSERLTSIPEGNFYTNVAFVKGSGAEGASAESASNAVEVKVVEPGTQTTTTNPPGNSPGAGNGSGTAGTPGSSGSGTTTGTGSKGSSGTLGTKKSAKKKVHKVTVAHKTPRFTG